MGSKTRRFKFFTLANILRSLPILGMVGTLALFWFGYSSFADMKAERAMVQSAGATKDFSAGSFDNEDSLPSKVDTIYQSVVGFEDRLAKIEQGSNNEEDNAHIRDALSSINKSLSTLSANASNATSLNSTQDARIERIEKLIKKMAQGGGINAQQAGSTGGRTDGAVLSQSGSAMYGEDIVMANIPPKESTANKSPAFDYYIPSGSRVKIELLDYILAPAGGLQQITADNTAGFPGWARILDDIELPDGSIVPLSEEGIVQLSVVGDATNERGMPRVKTLRFYNGQSFYELGAVGATIVDAVDNAPGLMGKLDQDKRTAEITKAAVLQATKIFTSSLAAKGGASLATLPTVNQTTGAASAPNINFGAMGWAAAGGSVDQFMQFFLDQAATFFDVVHVSNKIAVKRKNGKIELMPHQAYLVFSEGVFVKKTI